MSDKCDDCLIGLTPYAFMHMEKETTKLVPTRRYKYCPECGHKIDWEKLDDNSK